MLVTVMQIWDVRVRVCEFLMLMAVRVSNRNGAVVKVLMMPIVMGVLMLMHDRSVYVFVFVAGAQ